MEYIDFHSWKRKEHYKFFEQVDNPFYTINFNIDVTNFLKFVRKNKVSYYYSMIYFSTVAMNEVEEFKYKIRDGKIIYHDSLQPSFIDMDPGEDLFKIVTLPIGDSIIDFSVRAKEKSRNQKEYFPKTDMPQDKLIYYSCLPWISFTSVTNEIINGKEDSIPKVFWGKYFKQGDKILLPYSIEVNHMLIDGIHIGKFIEKLQKYIDELK